MQRFSSLLPAFCGALLLGTLAPHPALAATVTDIAIPYTTNGLYSNWSGANNGSQIAAASTSGNTGTGITFGDWSGQFNQINPSQTTTFSFGNVLLGTNTTVNALFNSFYGTTGDQADITFTNSLGQTLTVSLFGGDTIRDYNQNSYTNSLTGGSLAEGVTAQNWWNNGGNQRLDVDTFYLPTAWAGSSLVSMVVANATTGGANPNPDDVLSALQVVTTPSAVTPPTNPGVTPEPSSFVLLGTGVLSLAGAARRKLARA